MAAASERIVVRVTRHFTRNLDGIGDFLHEADAQDTFEALLDDLFLDAIPALERFPELGADFFGRAAASREGAQLAENLRLRLGRDTALRQLIRGDYLLPYARRQNELFLLAIRHHRQLSFDLPEFLGE